VAPLFHPRLVLSVLSSTPLLMPTSRQSVHAASGGDALLVNLGWLGGQVIELLFLCCYVSLSSELRVSYSDG
jgi:hypothetical protein